MVTLIITQRFSLFLSAFHSFFSFLFSLNITVREYPYNCILQYMSICIDNSELTLITMIMYI